jgi:hypothetical protein
MLINNNKAFYLYNNSYGIEYNNIKYRKNYKDIIDRYAYVPYAKTY